MSSCYILNLGDGKEVRRYTSGKACLEALTMFDSDPSAAAYWFMVKGGVKKYDRRFGQWNHHTRVTCPVKVLEAAAGFFQTTIGAASLKGGPGFNLRSNPTKNIRVDAALKMAAERLEECLTQLHFAEDNTLTSSEARVAIEGWRERGKTLLNEIRRPISDEMFDIHDKR